MASKIVDTMASKIDTDVKMLVWGSEIKDDVFKRWSQGLTWSDDEPTALLQHEGGPCAVIAPIQSFFLKNLLFSGAEAQSNVSLWNQVQGAERDALLVRTLVDMLTMLQERGSLKYNLVTYNVTESSVESSSSSQAEQPSQSMQGLPKEDEEEEEEIQPKKQCFSHEQFHSYLRCTEVQSRAELQSQIERHLETFQSQYGVLLLLYSFILTKGVEQIKNEVEDHGERLIDPLYGHGTQSLINLLITGRAVSNVWDNDKDVSGLKLYGITNRSTIGFLTQLEHLRYLEVGWYLKNPTCPIWLLGSETHLTVLFSQEEQLVCSETPEAAARRAFSDFDKNGSGFILAETLGDLMGSLKLVDEPEYVKIMREKLDPEQLGIVTLASFMEEFFPSNQSDQNATKFTLYHYNGLARSCPLNKVKYIEGVAHIMDMPELQIITDTSAIKTCLMTKWPTVELSWQGGTIPSLN